MDPRQKEVVHQHASQDLEYLGQLLQELYPDVLKNVEPEQFLEILRESPLKIFEDLEQLGLGENYEDSVSF